LVKTGRGESSKKGGSIREKRGGTADYRRGEGKREESSMKARRFDKERSFRKKGETRRKRGRTWGGFPHTCLRGRGIRFV